MRQHEYPALQILRGLAATAVVANHVWRSPPIGRGFRDILRVGDLAYLGVMAFFCLSGMLMVLSLKPSPPGVQPASLFLRSRVERIYPAYVLWLSVLLTIAIAAAAAGSGFPRNMLQAATANVVIRNYLLLPGLPGEDYKMFIGQAWTLVYEMYFYVVFSACLLFLDGSRLLIALCTVIGLPVLVSWLSGYQVDRLGWVNIAYLTTDPLVLNFLMGGLFGTWLRPRRAVGVSLPMTGRPGVQWSFVAAALIAAMLPLPSGLSFAHNIASAALVVAMTFAEISRNWATRALVYLGDASYSIYISHVVFAIVAYQAETKLPLPRDLVGVLLTISSIIVGCLSYELFEKVVGEKLRSRRSRIMA